MREAAGSAADPAEGRRMEAGREGAPPRERKRTRKRSGRETKRRR
jgi:hypothetical protein